MTIDKSERDQIRAFVARIENVEHEVSVLNSDKSDIYKEIKDKGFDPKAIKAVVARRRKDPGQLDLFEAVVQQYEMALGSGTVVATHVHEAESLHVA